MRRFSWSVLVGVTPTKNKMVKINTMQKYCFLLNDFLFKPWMLAGQFLGDASHQYLNQTPFLHVRYVTV
jgi:hypothetical protein